MLDDCSAIDTSRTSGSAIRHTVCLGKYSSSPRRPWCQGWMHRCCAGLSAHIFAEISNTSDESEPFLCVYCVLANQAAKIKQLKDSLNSVLSCLPSQNSTAHPPTTNPAANALQPQNNDLSQDISDNDL